mgnify:FL=1
MGILSGLKQFGLGELENASLYEKPDPKEIKKDTDAPVVKEADILFDKKYVCPICEAEFKTKTIRAGKARRLGTDQDLRPRYEGIDVVKYDPIVCPHCGYAVLGRYYELTSSMQAKMIRAGICAHYKPVQMDGEIYTYEQALERYKLTLANAIVKKAKASEKAYICLKSSWLLHGMLDEMAETDPKPELLQEEREYRQSALEGFLAARQSEAFPICGMDELTVDYLIAVLSMEFEHYDMAAKLLSGILVSQAANKRIKDRARDLKDDLRKKMKEQKNG